MTQREEKILKLRGRITKLKSHLAATSDPWESSTARQTIRYIEDELIQMGATITGGV